MIRGLPETSALHREMAGPRGGWGVVEELLAMNTEVAHTALSVLVKVNSKKGAKTPDVLHIPRPWEQPEERRKPSREDYRRALLG